MTIGVGNRQAAGELAFRFDSFILLKNWAARFLAAQRHYQSFGDRLLARDTITFLTL
jgi:hypothetical protein